MCGKRVNTESVESEEDMLARAPGNGGWNFDPDEVRRERSDGCVVETLDVCSYLTC